MQYIESPSNDAYFNMALEEYVFEMLPRDDSYFMLWQNENAIVVGKYQNTMEEIDLDFVREQEIAVVRRLSGGGAMYQDMGNLNFTFVTNQNASKSLDFSVFITPVVQALAQIGVTAQHSSRNDIVIDGKKFSGNSQYNKRGRTMHHGTLLFCSNLDMIGGALKVKPDKIESKGIKSVRSRVTNICDYLPEKIGMEEFKKVLLQHMFAAGNITPYSLDRKDLESVKALRDAKYATWQWNYGRSPAYNVHKHRKFDFGGVDIMLDVKDGAIQNAAFTGDFFGNGDIEELVALLVGTAPREDDLNAALAGVDVGYYISGMDTATLAHLIAY